MQDSSNIIACLGVGFVAVFYQKKKNQNFGQSLIKSQISGLES